VVFFAANPVFQQRQRHGTERSSVGLALKSVVIPLVLPGPKVPDERVFDVMNHFGAEVWIGEHPIDAQKDWIPAGAGCVPYWRHPFGTKTKQSGGTWAAGNQ